MPVFGQGVVPAGSYGGANLGGELNAVTRRAFVPKMIVQIYNSTPFAASLLSTAQSATGGVSSVSVPVQGQAYVNTQYSDYTGTFSQPAVQQGAFLAEFNLKVLITPIPFLGMEGLVQLDHAVIPLIEARMNDATNSMILAMTNSLYGNFSNLNQIIGLSGAIDDGTNLATYGNISRSTTNTWFQSKIYYNAGGAVNPTRQNVLQWIAGTVKNCGEVPTYGLCGPGTWTLLAQDFVGQETYVVTPDSAFSDDGNEGDGIKAAFRALMVGGVPIYMDPYCPEGNLWLPNTNYMNLYVHEQASFAFTGFESLLPNWQLGFVGAVVTAAELVNAKPKASTKVANLNSISI
jgi:hypothetical protein